VGGWGGLWNAITKTEDTWQRRAGEGGVNGIPSRGHLGEFGINKPPGILRKKQPNAVPSVGTKKA